MQIKRPMLAAPTKEADLRALKWPKLISAKIDGIRMLVGRDELGRPVCLSRKMLPIPNLHVQALFAHDKFVGLDGELVCGEPWAKDCYRKTNSAVMSVDGEADVKWYVFDDFTHPKKPYVERALAAKKQVQAEGYTPIYWLPQKIVRSYEEVLEEEEAFLSSGYEGAMLRCPKGPYKENRSTLRQEWLLKVKRFVDSDAEVVGTIELMHNDNEATTDETGYTKRSSHKAGKSNSGTLGALVVKCCDKNDLFFGVQFEVGTGFTAKQRENLWKNRKYLTGKKIKYKYFPVGCKDKPRHPVFLGWRDD